MTSPNPRFVTPLEARRAALFPGVTPKRIAHEFGPWLGAEIQATAQARGRFRRWALLGTPEVSADSLAGTGEAELLRFASSLLAKLPPPVIWYVVQHCFIVAVGRTWRGFCASDSAVVGARIVALSGHNLDSSLVLHELAHAWLHGSDDSPGVPIVAHLDIQDGPRRFVAALERAGSAGSLRAWLEARESDSAARLALDERQANALARSWLRRITGVTVGAQPREAARST
jgi:hypothetical protein